MKHVVIIFLAGTIASCSGGSGQQEQAAAAERYADSVEAIVLAERRVQASTEGLLGEWESVQDSGRTVFNEQWWRDGEKALAGIGFVMSGPDTVFVEHLRLTLDKVPAYIVRSPSENGNEEVHFTLRAGCCAEGRLTFENPAHDWPQTIDYTRTSNGWEAVVSGTDKGKVREARFSFLPRTKR